MVPENGTDFGNAMCHVALKKSTGLNVGLQNYDKNYDEEDSDSDSENEDFDDYDMPDACARNNEDTNSSDYEAEGNLNRAPIDR